MSRIAYIVRRPFFLFLYCLPCIASLIIILGSNYARSIDVVKSVNIYVDSVHDSTKDIPKTMIENNFIAARLKLFLEKQKKVGQLKSYTQEKISEVIWLVWVFDSSFIVALSLLPFLILGVGFVSKGNANIEVEERRRIALGDWPMKFFVGFIIASGWLYLFHPFGQGASIAYGFVKLEDIISTDTYPIYLDYRQVEIKHTIMGFLGWYLHLIGYFFYRFYKGDVIGTRIYGVLFKKFLFVFGIALILGAMTKNEALLVIFLIGFFPLSAFSIIREAGLKFALAGEQMTLLSALPGISRWDIIRLEEESVDSISSMATVDLRTLKRVTTIQEELLELWKDTAILMTMLGTEKYESVKQLCRTASEFVKRSRDDQFKNDLAERYQIANPEEIARLLRKTFGVTSAMEDAIDK